MKLKTSKNTKIDIFQRTFKSSEWAGQWMVGDCSRLEPHVERKSTSQIGCKIEFRL